MSNCDFDCMNCGEPFVAAWDYGDDVTCPHCNTRFETDWDENADGDRIGPWLYREAKPDTAPPDGK